jgi:Ca-activated chloride channel family protein
VSFEWPLVLVGLLAVPLAALLYLHAQRRRLRYAARYTNVEVLARVAGRTPSWRRHLPAAALLLALAALVVALARPMTTVAVPRERATVMLVTDVSASMAASDVTPTRLDAAKDAARSFMDEVPAELRVGLVAFNEAPQLLARPTRERQPVYDGIDSLRTGPGTGTGDGLEQALKAIREDGAGGRGRPPAAIVLLSDGKTTTGRDPVDVARRARRLGIPISTVALGTDAGFVQIGGALVPVPPDRATMRQVARVSGGRAFDVADGDELSSVYERLGSRLGNETEEREVTAAFAAGGLVLLLAGVLTSLRWSGRFPS